MGVVLEDTTTIASNSPPTKKTNQISQIIEAKKRRTMLSKSDVLDHYNKWDQKIEGMQEGDEP